MADDEQEALVRKRSELLGQFLEEHWDVFCVHPAVELDEEPGDDTFKGPEMLTGAILVLRSTDTGGDGELMSRVVWPRRLGWSEKLGMIERLRLYEQER